MRALVLLSVMIFSGWIATTRQLDAEEQDPDLLYRAKCTACHKVYPPRNYTYQKFQAYVTRYGKGLSDEERRSLSDYLKENAKQENGEGDKDV